MKEQLSSYKEESIGLQSQVSSFKSDLDIKTKQCSELQTELLNKVKIMFTYCEYS